MPIIERTPKACVDRFKRHIQELVSGTLSSTAHLECWREGDWWAMGFTGTKGGTIPIRTKFGVLHLDLSQALSPTPEGNQFRLETSAYWYRIQRTSAGPNDRAILRWEYDRCLDLLTPAHCRNHVQIEAKLPTVHGHKLDLDKVHIPTGWVTIEEIIRFLIKDLGVPSVSRDWSQRLAASEKVFYEEFASKNCRGS
jgi:hypothetical protein